MTMPSSAPDTSAPNAIADAAALVSTDPLTLRDLLRITSAPAWLAASIARDIRQNRETAREALADCDHQGFDHEGEDRTWAAAAA